jgi:hypothetical protein
VKITMALTCFLFRAVGLTAHGTALGPTIRLMPTSLGGEGNEIERREATGLHFIDAGKGDGAGVRLRE